MNKSSQVCKLHISYPDGNAYIKYTFMNHYLLSCICVVLCTLLKTNPAGRYSLIVDCILYLSDYKHAADCPSLQLKQIVCQYILCVRQCLMSPRCWLSLFLCYECSVFSTMLAWCSTAVHASNIHTRLFHKVLIAV